MKTKLKFPVWNDKNGNSIACTEKIKVMHQNMEEISQLMQDAFEDALLMGCEENQVRKFFTYLTENIKNPYNL